jgi:hypothetical protein
MAAAIDVRRPRPSPAVPITLSVEERTGLERLCRAGTTERRLADRAQAMLLAAAGWGNATIAAYLHRTRYWVQRWRHRFARERLAGLADRPRRGRPQRLSPPATGRDRRAGLHSARGGGPGVGPLVGPGPARRD